MSNPDGIETVDSAAYYRSLILDDSRMDTPHHMRIFNYWCPRVGAPTAYELARVAFSDNGRYLLLKARHAV